MPSGQRILDSKLVGIELAEVAIAAFDISPGRGVISSRDLLSMTQIRLPWRTNHLIRGRAEFRSVIRRPAFLGWPTLAVNELVRAIGRNQVSGDRIAGPTEHVKLR
jgi:hypothetical protein